MEVKKITEGMTAVQVAELIDQNFKNQNKILEEDIAKQNNVIGVSEYKDFSEVEAVSVGDVRKYNGLLYECVEATTGAFDAAKWKATSFKKETEAKLSELGSEVQSNYLTGKSVGSLGREYDNVGWNCTDYIPYNGGDIEWTYGESSSNQQIALCTYDKDKKFIDKFLASDSSGKRTITSDRTELVGAAYLRASFTDLVLNENPIKIGEYEYKPKDSVRTELNNIKKDVNNNFELVGKRIELVGERIDSLNTDLNGNYYSGKSVGSLGLEYDNIGWNCSDFIPYSGGNIEWTYGASSSNQQIALCTYDSDKKFIDKFLASDSSGKRTITSDRSELIGAAYIRASFNDSVVNGTPIKIGEFAYETAEGVKNKLSKTEYEVISQQSEIKSIKLDINGSESNYLPGKSVGSLGLEYDNIGWNCSDFIPYSGGDIEWTYGASSSNQQIALCTYDSDKKFIDKFLASDSSGKRTITSDRSELIGAAYIRASFNDSVINGTPIKIGEFEYRATIKVIGIEKYIGRSEKYSSDILTYSEYVDNNGLFHLSSSGSNRSDFIRVFKGDVIEVDSSNSDDTNKISLYSEQNTSSFVVGVKNYAGELTYEVPQDGYIVVCSSNAYNETFRLNINHGVTLNDRVKSLENNIGETQIKSITYSSDILTYSEYVDNNGLFHLSSSGSNRSDFIRVFKGDVIEVDSSNSDDTNKISLYSEQNTSSFVVGVKNYAGELTYEVPQDGYIVVCSSVAYNNSFSLGINRLLTINERVKMLEDGISNQSESVKPSDIPIFEPLYATEEFTCEVGYDKAYINTDHQTFLSDYYDKYAFKHYDNYSVIKYTLGMDAAQDGHEIFCYEFAPKHYTKTVLLSSGMNCCELTPILGVAYFIKSLMDDYSNDVGLKWMRENVRFVVIPFICPSSFDVVPCRYTNANDVRINKNFNYRKSWFSMGNFAGLPGTKGDAPDSEIETKLLKQWISSYRGANLWIDCHADLSINQPNKLIEVFYSDSNTGAKVKSTFNKIKQFYVDKGYITNPSSVVMNGSQEVNTFPKTLYSYNEIGIPALMIEQWALSIVYGSDPTKQCDSYAIKNYVTLLHQYIMACV